jgi:hypothetical protein
MVSVDLSNGLWIHQVDTSPLRGYSVVIRAIPYPLSFYAPEHGGELRAVEASLGLSFL